MQMHFVFLVLLLLWGSLSLWLPVSDWGFLYTHPKTYQKLFLVFFDAFSSRCFKTNVLIPCILSLIYTSVSCILDFFCLARYGLRDLLLRCTCSPGTPGFVRLSQPLVFCFWLRLLTHTSWDISTAFFSFSLMLSLRAFSKQTLSFSTYFSLLHTSVSCFLYLLFLLV